MKSYGYMAKSGRARSCGGYVSGFVKNIHIDCGTTICTCISNVCYHIPHACQHLLSIFLYLAIVTRVIWNLREFYFAFLWWLDSFKKYIEVTCISSFEMFNSASNFKIWLVYLSLICWILKVEFSWPTVTLE